MSHLAGTLRSITTDVDHEERERMAIATWELQTTTGARCHPAGPRRVADPVRPSPARRSVPPTANDARAATRGVATASLRRGLALLALLVIAVVAPSAGLLPVGGAAEAADRGLLAPEGNAVARGAPAAEIRAVVADGDTVWGLALPHTPAGAHPQEFVLEVLELNGLEATAVLPGTVVRIPLR